MVDEKKSKPSVSVDKDQEQSQDAGQDAAKEAIQSGDCTEGTAGHQVSGQSDEGNEGFDPLREVDRAISRVDDLLPVGDYEEEELSEEGERVRRKGVYLLPNLFTTAALFSGFYAIVNAMNGAYEPAAIAIFFAMLFDGLDGRVARLTNTQSAFGSEYDSLSDMVSFGVAPALVMFAWALSHFGKLGWAVAFIYIAGAALRLARFNLHTSTADANFFTGLASPAAAALVASFVWLCTDGGFTHEEMNRTFMGFMCLVVTALAGMMMVTNIEYHSFKGLNIRGRVPFVALLVVVLVFFIITIDPARMLFAIALIYALSGLVLHGIKKLRG